MDFKSNFDTKVGCRLPWDKWSQEEGNVCTSRQQFRLFPFLSIQRLASYSCLAFNNSVFQRV